MDRYEFKVPGTVVIAVNADSEAEAAEIAGYRIGFRTEIPQPASSAAQVVAVIPDEGARLKLDKVVERD